MAKTQSAITAIRGINEESFVATTLFEMGWSLQYRATTIEGLKAAAEMSPDAMIIATKDYLCEGSTFSNFVIYLDSTAELSPLSLQELLRQADANEPRKMPAIPPSHINTTLITTLDSGVGGTTCAITIGHEISLRGRKTLLLDLNQENPGLSHYFDIQRINRKIAPSQFGFYVSEVSEITYFSELAQQVNDFEEVVIDLGKIVVGERFNSGVRIHEIAARWSAHSATSIFIVTRADVSSLMKLKLVAPEISNFSRHLKPTILLLSQTSLSARERKALIERAEGIFAGEVRYLPRETRMVERAATERAPISEISPKSLLSREFASLVDRQLKRDR